MLAALDRRSSSPALIVPDEQSWVAWGMDPVSQGLEPVLDAGRVRRVLLPDALPRALVEPLATWLRDLPAGVCHEHRPAPGLLGPPSRAVVERMLASAGDEQRSRSGEHGSGSQMEAGGDDEDMMAITGEPSADGLVMEPIELSLGPVGSPLPGGVVADVVLDGDVVAECTVRATLRQPAPASDASLVPPDLLAPASWAAVIAAAAAAGAKVEVSSAARWLRLANVELERAVSHLAWLRALARLLGWAQLIERVTAALAPLLSVRASVRSDRGGPAPVGPLDARLEALAVALAEVRQLDRVCGHGRRLASRTAGLGRLSSDEARRGAPTGPAARASGIAEDARSEDPLYLELAFEPVLREEGDALARTLLRLDEALAAIELAQAALARAHTGANAPVAVAGAEVTTLEGPRGPLRARRSGVELRLEAPGQDGALAAAGRAAVGLEWAAALVALVSFDLSPWQAGR